VKNRAREEIKKIEEGENRAESNNKGGSQREGKEEKLSSNGHQEEYLL